MNAQLFNTTIGLTLWSATLVAGLAPTGATAAGGTEDLRPETPTTDVYNDNQAVVWQLPHNNRRLQITGTKDGGLDTDIWGVKVNRVARAVRVNSSSGVRWVLDENNNGFPDDGEKVFDFPAGQSVGVLHVRNSPTLLAIPEGSGTFSYNITARSLPVAARKVTATIIRAEALDNFDGALAGEADFRASIEFEPSQSSSFGGCAVPYLSNPYCYVQTVVSNDNTPTFNLSGFKIVSISNRNVPIKFSLVDQDPGKDDAADISPGVATRNLELTYDASQRKVRGPTGEVLGSAGEVLSVQGTDSNRRARIFFRIDTQEPIGPRVPGS